MSRKAVLVTGVILALFVGALILANGGATAIYEALPESGVARQRREQEEWERYKIKENCQLTGREESITTRYPGTATRYGTIGGYSSTRISYEWKCRGGDIHWR